MLNPLAAWGRLMTAALDASRTAQNTAETLAASRDVIGHRTALIGQAIRSPLHGDYAELSRMAPEKIAAFSQAGMAIAHQWWGMQMAWWDEAQRIGATAMRGGMPTAEDISAITAHAVRTVEQSVAIGSGALAPIHARATSNARRLNRRKRG